MNTKFEYDGLGSVYMVYLDPRPEGFSPAGHALHHPPRSAEAPEPGEAEYFYLTPADRDVAEIPLTGGARPAAELQAASGSAEFIIAPLPPADAHLTTSFSLPASYKGGPPSKPRYEGFAISHYQVERAIGRGGMGDVYLARDQRLGRPVALKLLRADYQPTDDRVRRFQQEARAVCALNHPNIVTIYEVGEVDGAPFIVSEFIEGDTLRQLIPPAGMRLDQALEIAVQIGNALAAAHQMGVIHRDIKPENVMVRSDGYVKVLDFGLAKLSDALEDRSQPDSSRGHGVVMGTITYMSPEQARGHKVDPRTDVFSLGIVLQEMLTGHKPFDGRNPPEILAAILNREAPPIASYKPDEPPGIQQIITRALRKDRNERYSTMGDMIRDLRELKNEVALQSLRGRKNSSLDEPPDLGGHIGEPQVVPVIVRAGSPGTISSSTSWPASLSLEDESADFVTEPPPPPREPVPSLVYDAAAEPPRKRNRFKLPQSGEFASAQPLQYWPTVKAAPARPQRRSRTRVRAMLFAVTAFSLLIAGAIFGWRSFRSAPVSFDQARFTKFTSTGRVVQAAISPDGGLLAYTQLEAGGKQGLWLRRIESANGVLVVPPRPANYPGLSFSRDGRYLYFLLREEQASTLHRMVLGSGALEKLPLRMDGVDGAFALSADGDRVAFVQAGAGGESALMVADLNSEESRPIATRPASSGFRSGGLAWSPEGERILCAVADPEGNASERLIAITLLNGTVQGMSDQPWHSVDRIVWLDGGMLVAGRPLQDPTPQLWVFPASGEARRVTDGHHQFTGLSLTADGGTIATTQVYASPDAAGARASDVVLIHATN